jgi:hypothetical protein
VKTTKSKRDTAGDCVSHPEHGAAYALTSGRLWCAHQSHDNTEGDSAFIDKQTAPAQEGTTPKPEPVNDPTPDDMVIAAEEAAFDESEFQRTGV